MKDPREGSGGGVRPGSHSARSHVTVKDACCRGPGSLCPCRLISGGGCSSWGRWRQAPGRQLSEHGASTLTVTPEQAVGTWEEGGRSRSSCGARRKTGAGPLPLSSPRRRRQPCTGPDLGPAPSLPSGGCVPAGPDSPWLSEGHSVGVVGALQPRGTLSPAPPCVACRPRPSGPGPCWAGTVDAHRPQGGPRLCPCGPLPSPVAPLGAPLPCCSQGSWSAAGMSSWFGALVTDHVTLWGQRVSLPDCVPFGGRTLPQAGRQSRDPTPAPRPLSVQAQPVQGVRVSLGG